MAGSLGCGNDTVPKAADLFDLHRDLISGDKIARGIHSPGHAHGSSRSNQVAWLQRHSRTDVGNECSDIKDHLAGIDVLPHLAVHRGAQVELLRVGDFVARNHPGTARCIGVGGLAGKPLLAAMLHVPGGDVVQDGVAEDVIEGAFGR